MHEEEKLNSQDEEKVTVRNVALVDLRNASEQTLERILRIENAAAVLYSRQNATHVSRVTMLNVAAVMEVSAAARLITGQETLEKNFHAGLDEPLSLVVVGQLILAPDIEAEDLRLGIDKLTIAGQLLYPEHVGGVIQSKLAEVSGQSVAYPRDSQLTVGRLDLTRSTLEALDDGSALTVVGAMSARHILPNDLLARKLRELRIVGSLTCREENASVLSSRLQGSIQGVHTKVIPQGFEPVRGPVTIDAALLDALPARRLYCSELRFADDVAAEQLDNALDALIVSDLLVAPASLRTVLGSKCNLLETETVLYEGTLWHFDDEHVLYPQRFEYVDGMVTMVITGELTLAAELAPALLAQRVDKVHNLGEIMCTAAQMSALQNRMGLERGEFVVSGAEDAVESGIGNTAYLKL
jgi:hypothetical protein